MDQQQAAILNELIEDYASARAYHYYIEDQGGIRQTERAAADLESAKINLDNYIRSITE